MLLHHLLPLIAGIATLGPLVASAPAAEHHQEIPAAVSSRDRVYLADQTSNTVSVIDPVARRTLGTITLGAQRLGAALNPQYLDNAGVHGLAVSRNNRRLAVVSVTSNTVDIVDTASNRVLNRTDVGRAPHEGSFTADGRFFWVANRGRDTVSIVDVERGGLAGQVVVGSGPSKVVMSPDGKLAYVNHTSKPELTVVDVARLRVVDRITGLGDVFSSDQAISPDGRELWASHKRAGKISVVDLVRREVRTVLTTGPDTNHPNFADTATGKFVYLTIGGLDQTVVYRRTGTGPQLVTRIDHGGRAPHGLWPSGDGSQMYVGLEKSDAVDVIDTATHTVSGTIPVGQEPQALVYAVRAAPADGSAPNLGRQGLGQPARVVPTTLPDGSAGDTKDPVRGRTLEATVRPVNGLDMVQLQARGLLPATRYQASAVNPDGLRALVSFTTDAGGNAPQVLAFVVFVGTGVAITPITGPVEMVVGHSAGCGCCC